MEWVFLGTGAGIPSKERQVSSAALRFNESGGDTWLFDCGEATQHQILNSSVKLTRISHILISHLHGDHIFGLPGLLGSRSFQCEDSPLVLLGPPGIHSFVESALSISQTHIRYPLEIKEWKNGDTYDWKGYQVEVTELDHVILSAGFRITEPDQPGSLLTDRLREAGVPAGPHLKRLKNGEDIRLEDGRLLRSQDFCGPRIPGRRVVYCGDTRPARETVELARNADMLIHEATFSKEKESHALRFGHSTAAQAAELARKAEVKQLILNHISSRYSLKEGDRLLEEAREIFPRTEMAFDFSVFPVSRGTHSS